jgi:site-specific recombinase XerD
MRAAWRLGQLDTDTYERGIDAAKNVNGKSVPAGRDLAGGELGALAAACAADPTPAGCRDAAMIGILYTAGLRRAELAALQIEDYDRSEGRLLVRGKGNKERYVYPAAGALAALDAWLSLRGRSNTRDFAPATGPMFTPVNKAGAVDPRKGITAQAIYNMLEKRAGEAGVEDFTPHDLRRTFVSAHLEAGTDIATVAAMAGHANVQTTARYDRRGERAKAAASGALHWSYAARQRRQR